MNYTGTGRGVKRSAEVSYNCAIHGQNMSDACICRGARYWMDRCLASEKRNDVEAEREACAVSCEILASIYSHPSVVTAVDAAMFCAARIRQRGTVGPEDAVQVIPPDVR